MVKLCRLEAPVQLTQIASVVLITVKCFVVIGKVICHFYHLIIFLFRYLTHYQNIEMSKQHFVFVMAACCLHHLSLGRYL